MVELQRDRHIGAIDIFLTAASFEDRGPRAREVLKENEIVIKTQTCIIFKDLWKFSKEEERNYLIKQFNLDESCTIKVECETFSPERSIREIRKSINTQPIQEKSIAVDITSFTKPYLFCILKMLQYEGVRDLICFYTEPGAYPPEYSIGRGISEAKTIPGFFGDITVSEQSLLIAIMGFDGNQLLKVIHDLGAGNVVPILGFPSFQPQFKDRCLLSNIDFLEMEEIYSHIRYAAANDPFETAELISEIYNRDSRDSGIIVAPLGSKPQALGACITSLEHDDIRVVCPVPKRYARKTSTYFGKTWRFNINLPEMG